MTRKMKSAVNSMLTHPPRTPDLAPSDFFLLLLLFGHLKSLLVGKNIQDEIQLLDEIIKAFRTITKEMKQREYNEWLSRLEAASKGHKKTLASFSFLLLLSKIERIKNSFRQNLLHPIGHRHRAC